MSLTSEDMIRKTKGTTMYRAMHLERQAIDTEKRTVEVAFSSEDDSVERYFGVEILDHSKASVRMHRLNNGGAVLFNHRSDNHIGVIESARIDPKDRMGRAVLRFGQSTRAQEAFQDIVDGILRHVSVGYVIHEMVREKTSDKEPDRYRVTDWEPLEVSMVPVPADPTVGVGRDYEYLHGHKGMTTMAKQVGKDNDETLTEQEHEEEAAILTKGKRTKDLLLEDDEEVSKEFTKGVNAKELRKQIQQEELDRCNKIREICRAAGEKAKGIEAKALAGGFSAEDTRKAVFELITRPEPLQLKSTELGLSEREVQSYSFLRAIAAACEKDWSLAPLEKEMSDAVATNLKTTPRSFFVPMDVLRGARVMPNAMQRAPLAVGSTGAGEEWVSTNLMAGQSFIEYLINLMMVKRLGAVVLTGLQGNLSLAKKTGHSTASWVAEDNAPSESALTTGQVPLAPKTLGAWTEITRKLLLQSSPDVENLVRQDLAEAIALAIDQACINGTGLSNQPLGILGQQGLEIVELGAQGAAPTWPKIVALETGVAVDNADIGSLAYLTNAKGRGKLKTVEKATNTGQFIWMDGNERGFGMVNGYRAAASNQVPSNLTKATTGTALSAMIFGNWADLVIGQWGFMDILVDPFTQSKKGNIIVTAHQDVDIAVRRVQSFAAIIDMVTT